MSLSLVQQALTFAYDFTICLGIAFLIAAYLDVANQRSQRSPQTQIEYSLPQLAPANTEVVVIEPVIHTRGLETMTWRQLVAVARPLKVKRYKSLNKAQLIDAIQDARSEHLVAAPC